MKRSGTPQSSGRAGELIMFTVMTWNLENFARPAAGAPQAAMDKYSAKVGQISQLITGAGPDLVGVQEVLASSDDLAPQVFDDLLAALGAGWNGCLSQRPDERGIRVGWLSRGQLTDTADIADCAHGVPDTTVDD